MYIYISICIYIYTYYKWTSPPLRQKSSSKVTSSSHRHLSRSLIHSIPAYPTWRRQLQSFHHRVVLTSEKGRCWKDFWFSLWKITIFMGESTISMVFFQSHGELPEGSTLWEMLTENYENHQFCWLNPVFPWTCSIAMLNYQKVTNVKSGNFDGWTNLKFIN